MSRRLSRGRGRRPLIAPEVQDRLIEAVRSGVPMDDAAEFGGIHKATFYRWLARGQDVEEAEAAGGHVSPEDDPYLQLYRRFREARATVSVRSLLRIQRAAAGGFITEESTERLRDPDTGEPVERTTVKRQAPDWRADAWLLERIRPDRFGRNVERVEITGADGGPVQLAHEPDAQDLADRLAVTLARFTPPTPELEAGIDEGDTG